MAYKWKDLKRSNESRSAGARGCAGCRNARMPLAEIRKALGMTQAELAGRLDGAQGSVSKLENAADMYVTTLRKYIESLGGELHLTAVFAGGRAVEIERRGGLDAD